MLHLYFSHQSEQLFDTFYKVLSENWKDPLAVPALLVPNRLVDRWLKLEIAQQDGVSSILHGVFLEKFFWNAFAEEGMQHLRGETVEQWILHILRPNGEAEAFKDTNLKPLFDYIEDSVIRRVQMAKQLARLFMEYELARPVLKDSNGAVQYGGLFEKWPKEDFFSASSLSNIPDAKRKTAQEIEFWQRALYGLLFGKGGMQERLEAEEKWFTLPRLVHHLQKTPTLWKEKLEKLAAEYPILTMWSSGLSLFHRQLMLDVSRSLDVHVFQLNPCAEFWEDVETIQRKGVRKRFNPQPPSNLSMQEEEWKTLLQTEWSETCIVEVAEADMPLLKSWGHIGKENIKLWCQMVHYDFIYLEHELEPDSLLHGIQHAILRRLPSLEQKFSKTDASLKLIEAPGIRREVEILRDNILLLLRDNPNYNLADIGVFCPDVSLYQVAFEEVFGSVTAQDDSYVPWMFAEEMSGQSLYAQAVALSISLVKDQRFDRQSIFAFLRNPLVQEAKRFSEEDLSVWEEWTDEMGVFYAYDTAHREQLGERNPETWHSFKQGIERLLLGGLISPELALEQDNTGIPFSNIKTSDPELVEKFIAIVESLWSALTVLQNSEQTWESYGKEWVSFLYAWLDIPESLSFEKSIQMLLLQQIEPLLQRGELQEDSLVDQDEFLELLHSGLEFELPSRTNVMSGTLMVCRLQEGRPMPWKTVFILGMKEGDFPPSKSNNALDLRDYAPMPGDGHSMRQAQYAFLEVLMCVRDSLIISWPAVDLAKDRIILPSSVVIELEDFLCSAVLESKDIWNRKSYKIHAHEEEELVLENEELMWLSNFKETATKNHMAQSFSKANFDFRYLKNFLENPIDAFLSRELGLWEEENEDHTLVQDEPLGFDALESWSFENTFVKEYQSHRLILQDSISFEKLFGDCWRSYEKKGSCPEGKAKENLHKKLFVKMEAWFLRTEKQLVELEEYNINPDWSLSLKDSPIENIPEIVLAKHPLEASIHIVLSASKFKGKQVIESLLLSALSISQKNSETKNGFELLFLGQEVQRYTFQWTQEEAQIWLEKILQDCQSRIFDIMPLEGLLSLNRKSQWQWLHNTEISMTEWLLEDENSMMSQYRKSEALQLYSSQVPKDLQQKAKERFGILISEEES